MGPRGQSPRKFCMSTPSFSLKRLKISQKQVQKNCLYTNILAHYSRFCSNALFCYPHNFLFLLISQEIMKSGQIWSAIGRFPHSLLQFFIVFFNVVNKKRGQRAKNSHKICLDKVYRIQTQRESKKMVKQEERLHKYFISFSRD